MTVENSVGIIKDILTAVESQPLEFDDIVEAMTSGSSLKRTEVESMARLAKRFGFLKEEGGLLSPSITGNEFVKYIESTIALEQKEEPVVDETSLSVTIPPFCLPLPLSVKNQINPTSSTMKRVVADAQLELLIVTPFLDVPLLQSCFENVKRKRNAVIRILTSDKKIVQYRESSSGNMLLNEIKKLLESRFKDGQVFYLQEDMSIAHAKIFCSDRSMFITSANIKKDSISENFEAGIYTERKDIIRIMRDIVMHVMESGSETILDLGSGAGDR